MSTTSGHTPRSVVVVGASSGIGQAIVRRFLDDGDTVVGISHAALADAPFPHLVADCSDPSAATTAVLEASERLGGQLDVVVPAAAVTPRARATQTSDADWRAGLGATLDSTFFTCRAAIPLMVSGGAIVCISSITASIASPGISAYAAAKGGINALVRVLALELGGQGIRVNAVAPGSSAASISTTPATGTRCGVPGIPTRSPPWSPSSPLPTRRSSPGSYCPSTEG